jgi:hypothetical protein
MKVVEYLTKTVAKDLISKGLLIEGGWKIYESVACPPNTPAWQREEMRTCFFAGAQHLWASIQSTLDPEAEPTEMDMKRMELIDNELRQFYEQMKKKYGG